MKISPKFMVVCVCLLAAFTSGKPNKVNEKKNIVSAKCLRCLCVASTGCKLDVKCDGPVCGPYRISLPYWIDAGSPKVEDNDKDGEEEESIDFYSDKEYRDCANNLKCASRTVEAYMKRYATDCDGDGKVNCDDFARIHRLGPGACYQALDTKFEKAYKKCIKKNADDF